MTQPIAIHPETTASPRTLRWVVSHLTLPFAGPVASAPGLDDLGLTDARVAEQGGEPGTAVVERVEATADAVLVTLAPGRDWRSEGPAVRTALTTALGRLDEWVPGARAHELGPDDALRMCATELIEGPVGQIATAHGGSIELVEAHDGVVSVRMHGACKGCPAAVITMHQRLENQLRRRVPDLREVVEVR